VNGYALALFVHLLSLLLATVAASLSTFSALRLRAVDSAEAAAPWLALIGRVVPAFPAAVVGLLGSGIYMTLDRWAWSAPWIDAALVGLGLIVVLGNAVEATRGRALRREIESAGMSARARRLLRDPVSWSAKMTTLTLTVAVVFVMAVKPAGGECVAVVVLAVIMGVAGAVPMWRTPRVDASGPVRAASS
jgi:hypothetical protein